jgi:hypothetical protein
VEAFNFEEQRNSEVGRTEDEVARVSLGVSAKLGSTIDLGRADERIESGTTIRSCGGVMSHDGIPGIVLLMGYGDTGLLDERTDRLRLVTEVSGETAIGGTKGTR